MPANTKRSKTRNQDKQPGSSPAKPIADALEPAEVGGVEPAEEGAKVEVPSAAVSEWVDEPKAYAHKFCSEIRLVASQGRTLDSLLSEIRKRNLRVKKGNASTGAGLVGDYPADVIRLLLDGLVSGRVTIDLDGIQQDQQE